MASFFDRNPLLADGDVDREKLLIMKKKKKDFDHMTSSVLMEHQKHRLASLHFKRCYDHLLFLPSIGITLAGAMLAVLAQSGLYSDYTQELFTILIAVLATISVFWQSLVKQLDYGGRASLHDSTAKALAQINKMAVMKSREQQMHDTDSNFTSSMKSSQRRRPRRSSDSNEDLEDAEEGVAATDEEVTQAKPVEGHAVGPEGHFTLSKQFEQALQGCTSLVPIEITAAFDALESSVNVCNKRLVPSGNAKPKIAWEKVYPALYHQLTLTIIGSRGWPYLVPNAEWAVETTLKNFNKSDACLVKLLVERTQVIDEHYSSLATEITPLQSRISVVQAQTNGSEEVLDNGGILS